MVSSDPRLWLMPHITAMPLQLNPGEQVIIKTGRHRFILYGKVGQLIGMFAIILAISIVILSSLPPESPFRNIAILTLLLTTLFVWTYAFVVWLDYHLDIWIVTTERIIDTELLGLFQRNLSEFKLSRIQDVSVDVHGIFPTLLDYGNVHIQTAGVTRQFVFQQVPKPQKIKRLILEAHDTYMTAHLAHAHEAKRTGM